LEKPVEKLLKNNKLYLLIDKLSEVDFHPNVVDNHMMGMIFEELLRRFSEMSNETSGEHFSPRDIITLLVSLVLSGGKENLKGEGLIRSIFDCCSGTGGILTIGKRWIEENVSEKIIINLFGQELNPQTYSICKSDFLITGEKDDNSRIGIVFNGSPLFSGDSGSGESEIRKWIIENDWLECVVQLPDQLFFNTGITTYLWILSKKKSKERRGKIQLIDGSNHYRPLKKSLGSKRKEISEEGKEYILKVYNDFKENEISKIYPNEFFGYRKLTIEQPLVQNGKVVMDKKGNMKPDGSLRDSERIPLDVDVDDYFEKEVKPHLPNSWVDKDKTQIGYEINFTKYFYQYKPLRSVQDVLNDLMNLEKESDGLMNELIK
jgi:type I restriction-modification system DNA methylase subunit